MASPTEVTVFGGYFPFATRYSSTCRCCSTSTASAISGARNTRRGRLALRRFVGPVQLQHQGPDHQPRRSRRAAVFTFPTAGRFLTQFGVVPVTLPWEDIEVAVQTGELDGIAWSGITEDYTVGWADVTDYFLTNNISGAWIGSLLRQQDRWNALPEHLKQLSGPASKLHYYRNQWYWGGEAKLRANGDKLKLRSVPASEWKQVEDAAKVFWDEIAAESETKAKVVEIFRSTTRHQQAGFPYRLQLIGDV
jgi:hypothetical protein